MFNNIASLSQSLMKSLWRGDEHCRGTRVGTVQGRQDERQRHLLLRWWQQVCWWLVDDKMTGHGVHTVSDGDRYERWCSTIRVTLSVPDEVSSGEVTNTVEEHVWGQFKDGKMNGKGTYYFADGNKYVGDWVDNNRTGHGVFTVVWWYSIREMIFNNMASLSQCPAEVPLERRRTL